ncbi:MAG: NUDIX hydrolase [Planctomycetota bacterium]|jgi:8-oxo-dGTP pyrophosphatase MutT (NUDIX family)
MATESQDNSEGTPIRCPQCDYNLRGAPGDRCPWCGWEIDVDLLVASAGKRLPVARIGVIVTAFVCATGSCMGAYQFSMRAGSLSVREAMLIGTLLVAGIGHIGLAIGAWTSRRRWPMRSGELSGLTTLSAAVSIVGGIVGATSFYHTQLPPLVVRNATVGGVFEFLLAAILFTAPGWTLLLLRLVSFGQVESPAGTSRRRGPVNPTGMDGGAGAAPFCVDVCGRFDRSEVAISTTSSARKRHPVLEAGITRIWDAEVADAQVRGVRLYNGELARLAGIRSNQARLQLELGRTCYRDFMGTNLHQLGETLSYGEEYLANPLGISAVVLTSDGFLALGRRSMTVASHAGVLHAFGGMVETSDLGADGNFDVFGAMRRELQEELALNDAEILELAVVGLVRDRSMWQPELVFDASIQLTREALARRFHPDLSDGEHSEIVFVEDSDDPIVRFLASARNMAPVAQATLLLHGRNYWSHDWFDRSSVALYGKAPALTPESR